MLALLVPGVGMGGGSAGTTPTLPPQVPVTGAGT